MKTLEGDDHYKSKEFQNQHKYAFFKILTDYHKQYYHTNNTKLDISENIQKRTTKYLEESCDVVGWFRENYSLDNNTDNNGNFDI